MSNTQYGNTQPNNKTHPRPARIWWRPLTAVLSALALAAALLSNLPQRAQADQLANKADSFLNHRMATHPKAGWVSVLIQSKGDITTSEEAQLKGLDADVYRHLSFIHTVAARVPVRNVVRLASLGFVHHLSADVTTRKCDEFTVGSSEADVAFQQYGLTGNGITVAVVDSGVRTQKLDLATDPSGKTNRVIESVDFVSGKGQSTTADPCGHGTHVAGIIAGNGASSTGNKYYRTFYGIARQANIVSVRVLDSSGSSSVSTVLAGIQWVIQNQATYNIRVMNLSLGHGVGENYTNDPLCQAVEQAWKNGIVVVCAAGNNGRQNSSQTAGASNEGWGTAYGSIQSPANDPYVITVGATKSMDGLRPDDRIATYSSRGPSRMDFILKPDIVAPGNHVVSLLSTGSFLDTTYSATNQVPWQSYSVTNNTGNSDKYFVLSGTSMASPVVAGAAALLLQANPNLTPDTVKVRLMVSADKWTLPDGTTDICTFGAGYLNIPAALNCPLVATQYALSPTMSQDNLGNVNINMTSCWGTGLTSLQSIWGNMAIWGNNTISSSRAIWGFSIWGNMAIWGFSNAGDDLSSTAIDGE